MMLLMVMQDMQSYNKNVACPNRQMPAHLLFSNLHLRLHETGRCKQRGCWNSLTDSLDNEDSVDNVLDNFHQNPRTSTHAAAASMGIRDHTVV